MFACPVLELHDTGSRSALLFRDNCLIRDLCCVVCFVLLYKVSLRVQFSDEAASVQVSATVKCIRGSLVCFAAGL
jgi:hypothetical protein